MIQLLQSRRALSVIAGVSCAFLLLTTSVASAAGSNSYGGGGNGGGGKPSPTPFPTTGVVVAVKVNPAKTTHIAVAPSSASGNSQLAITVPAGAVPAGSTVVVAQLPTGLPPLYRVHQWFIVAVF